MKKRDYDYSERRVFLSKAAPDADILLSPAALNCKTFTWDKFKVLGPDKSGTKVLNELKTSPGMRVYGVLTRYDDGSFCFLRDSWSTYDESILEFNGLEGDYISRLWPDMEVNA